MDWLQHQSVQVIYLTDGTVIVVNDGSVRDAIDEQIARTEAQAKGMRP